MSQKPLPDNSQQSQGTDTHVPVGLFYIFSGLCTSSIFVSLSLLSCILPFCHYLQYTTKTPMPPAGFLFCILSYSVLVCLSWLSCILPLFHYLQHAALCPRRVSNSQSQQTSGSRSSTLTAGPLESAKKRILNFDPYIIINYNLNIDDILIIDK
jgi:hypothetical protein